MYAATKWVKNYLTCTQSKYMAKMLSVVYEAMLLSLCHGATADKWLLFLRWWWQPHCQGLLWWNLHCHYEACSGGAHMGCAREDRGGAVWSSGWPHFQVTFAWNVKVVALHVFTIVLFIKHIWNLLFLLWILNPRSFHFFADYFILTQTVIVVHTIHWSTLYY